MTAVFFNAMILTISLPAASFAPTCGPSTHSRAVLAALAGPSPIMSCGACHYDAWPERMPGLAGLVGRPLSRPNRQRCYACPNPPHQCCSALPHLGHLRRQFASSPTLSDSQGAGVASAMSPGSNTPPAPPTTFSWINQRSIWISFGWTLNPNTLLVLSLSLSLSFSLSLSLSIYLSISLSFSCN